MTEDASTPTEPTPRSRPRGTASPRALSGPLLVGVDETSPVGGALNIADLLARRDRVNAHLLGVIPPMAFPLALVLPVEYEAVEEARRQQLLARIRQQLSQTICVAAYWSTEAAVGHQATALARIGQARGSALVAIGLPGSNAPHRTALEDTALQIIRAVDVPVLAVPPQYGRLPRRALVAMDFSAASRRAARSALSILGPDPTITLAHVQADIEFELGPLSTAANPMLATVP